MTKMGFNCKFLDIEPQKPEEYEIPVGEEEQVKAPFEGKATNSAGGMFKIGLLVVNSRVMLKAKDRVDEMKKMRRRRGSRRLRRRQIRWSRRR